MVRWGTFSLSRLEFCWDLTLHKCTANMKINPEPHTAHSTAAVLGPTPGSAQRQHSGRRTSISLPSSTVFLTAAPCLRSARTCLTASNKNKQAAERPSRHAHTGLLARRTETTRGRAAASAPPAQREVEVCLPDRRLRAQWRRVATEDAREAEKMMLDTSVWCWGSRSRSGRKTVCAAPPLSSQCVVER